MRLKDFKLERYFATYECSAKYKLCCSDCESMTIEELLASEENATQDFLENRLGYTISTGSPTLRREISRLYSSIKADQVLVHSGAEEAIFLFMQVLFKPGDHIIVHWPCYQSLIEVACAAGCEVTKWRAREENKWEVDLDELRDSIRNNTRAVILNIPHNPTGYLMSRNRLEELVSIVREKDILLFSDEVYRELEYNIQNRLPAACDLYENAVSLGVMSKAYGLAGLRIGWIASHRQDIARKMEALKDYTTICCSAPSEFLAELALRRRDKIINRNLAIIMGNLSLLDRFFEEFSDKVKWHKPKAGAIAFPRLLTGNIDSFCDKLLKKTGVLLMPGNIFDHPGGFFRIGFGRKNMELGLNGLKEFLCQFD